MIKKIFSLLLTTAILATTSASVYAQGSDGYYAYYTDTNSYGTGGATNTTGTSDMYNSFDTAGTTSTGGAANTAATPNTTDMTNTSDRYNTTGASNTAGTQDTTGAPNTGGTPNTAGSTDGYNTNNAAGTSGTSGVNNANMYGNQSMNGINNASNMHNTTGTTNAGNVGGAGVNASRSQGIEIYGNIPSAYLNQNSSNNSNGQIKVSNDTYIVQDGDDLWIVMGNIKAKLDILIYTDPNNISINEPKAADKNSLAIPVVGNNR